MAVTLTSADAGNLPYYIDGAQKRTHKELTLSGTYATNGFSVTAANLGLNSIDTCTAIVKTGANAADALGAVQVDVASTGATATFELWSDDESTGPGELTNGDTVTNTVLLVVSRGS